MARVLRCALKLIENIEAAGKRSRETKVAKEPGGEILTKVMTKAPPESKIPDNTRPENPIKPRAPVRRTPCTRHGLMTPPKSNKYDTAEMEEIWGPSSAVLPQTNCSPSSPPVIAGSSKPTEGDSDELTYAPSSLILDTLRAGRRHLCWRGNCMSLQAPRRRPGRRAITKPKNQEAAIQAYFKACGRRHAAIGNSARAQEDWENCRAMTGRTRQPPTAGPSQGKPAYGPGLSRATSHDPDQAEPTYGPGLRHAKSYKP